MFWICKMVKTCYLVHYIIYMRRKFILTYQPFCKTGYFIKVKILIHKYPICHTPEYVNGLSHRKS